MAATGMPGPFDLMKGLSKVIFMNLMAMHFDADAGTFTDTAEFLDGMAQRGVRISAFNAGYTVMVLAAFIPEFAGTPLAKAPPSPLWPPSPAPFVRPALLLRRQSTESDHSTVKSWSSTGRSPSTRAMLSKSTVKLASAEHSIQPKADWVAAPVVHVVENGVH
jgi:hypothetical protein